MNINIHVVCRKDKINKNGTAPIHLRFTQKSKIRYISTGIVISPTLWDPNNQRIVIQDETTQDIQYRIDNILADYRKKIRRLEVLDIPVNFDTLLRPIRTAMQELLLRMVLKQKSNGWNRSVKSTRPSSTNTPCRY